MRKTGKRMSLMALMAWAMLSGCLLAACSVDDAESSVGMNNNFFDAEQYAVFDGEWTMNKQVVDTARLEVTNVLKVRLPEKYLCLFSFEDYYTSSADPRWSIEYKGLPTVIPFKDQGYTDNATFNSFAVPEKNYGMNLFFKQASFYATINGVDYRVDLLSDEPGNAIYRNDSGLWTIGFTVNSFLVTNLETQEEQVRTRNTPIVLYYNAKNRIR